jgi:hypothetical protein
MRPAGSFQMAEAPITMPLGWRRDGPGLAVLGIARGQAMGCSARPYKITEHHDRIQA